MKNKQQYIKTIEKDHVLGLEKNTWLSSDQGVTNNSVLEYYSNSWTE